MGANRPVDGNLWSAIAQTVHIPRLAGIDMNPLSLRATEIGSAKHGQPDRRERCAALAAGFRQPELDVVEDPVIERLD